MSTNIEQLNKELEEYRQLHKQALLDAERSTELARIATDEIKKAHDQLTMAQHQTDLDRNKIAALELRLAPASPFHTPVPQTNLSNQLQSAVPFDEQTIKTMIIDAITEVSREFDGRLNQIHQIILDDAVAREDRMLQNVQALITSFNTAASTSPMILPASTAVAIQTNNNVPAESTSPSSSQRADREQASAQAPRIERVGEYSNENTPSSPPQTENFVKRRLDTKRGRVRFSKTWSRDNCSPDHFISFMNTNLRCAIT